MLLYPGDNSNIAREDPFHTYEVALDGVEGFAKVAAGVQDEPRCRGDPICLNQI